MLIRNIALSFMVSCLVVFTTSAIEIGDFDLGGVIRVNYVNGDYSSDGSDAAQRGDNGGNFEMDVFRLNLDYQRGPYIGKAEYRWYDGYNFLHTGWVGYDFKDNAQVQVGLNRVPFGVGAYGAANSWFFDQYYYMGLSDDMDVGIKYTRSYEHWVIDMAYYISAESSYVGNSEESARYSYDIVSNGSPYSHYEEENQFNLRMVYKTLSETMPTDVGISLQWGQLAADSTYAEDSDAYAVAAHSRTQYRNWTLMMQLTQYDYNAKYKDSAVDENGVPLRNDLIMMGAYDFPWPVASKGIIPSVALSYTLTPKVDWIDSITFYNDYSVIIKDADDFNDSALNVTGMAIASGGWYIYVDYAYSNGNYFVGDEGDVYGDSYLNSSVGDFGANLNDEWKGRFNINFGYYF
ncbi:hypothetical protein P3T73_17885 [Kiritimatiellota bacterium B12222]|nr:hypothetical protein P3T73_17885 [Kiritimatiellota bacterium B12222]